MGKRLSAISIQGSYNTVHFDRPKKKKIDLPGRAVVPGAAKVAEASTVPSISKNPTGSLPLKIATTPAASTAPKQQSTQDKVKNFVSYFIITVGLLLLAIGVGALAGHAMGGVHVDPATIQAIFMSGLGAAVGGISLQNSDYKGSLTLGGGNLPFTFVVKQ